jgi:hypothetical protein
MLLTYIGIVIDPYTDVIVCQADPEYTHNFASVVSKMTVPAAGTIAFFCVVVMFGKRTPFVVD